MPEISPGVLERIKNRLTKAVQMSDSSFEGKSRLEKGHLPRPTARGKERGRPRKEMRAPDNHKDPAETGGRKKKIPDEELRGTHDKTKHKEKSAEASGQSEEEQVERDKQSKDSRERSSDEEEDNSVEEESSD